MFSTNVSSRSVYSAEKLYSVTESKPAYNDSRSKFDISNAESKELIVFVHKHGKSNSLKSYLFVDKMAIFGKHS